MLDRLIDTLLYEGYALYPYTPGAAKNATPTPFGIVFARVRAPGAAGRAASATPQRPRRGALPRRDRRAPRPRAAASIAVGGLRVRVALAQDGRRASLRVENLTPAPAGLDRMAALRSRCSRRTRSCYGPFRSPLDVVHAQRQHVSGAGRGRAAGRRDHPSRPPADRAREPRLAVRLDRDRGGAAAARADAHRRRARSRSPTRACWR